DFAAGFGASSLQRGAAGKYEYEVGAPGAEGDPECALEPCAVGEKQHNRGDAPGHAEHGKNAAAAIVAERVVGLASEFEDHDLLLAQRFDGRQVRGLAGRVQASSNAGDR